MDAQQFLKAFGHVANAPGGVDKLRELILSLAVTGRLVDQRSSEPPASEWLHACDKTKAKMFAEKKISKPTLAVDITVEEMPFDPPPGWSFARLARFTTKIGSGSTPRGGSQAYVKEGVPFLRSQNIWNDGVRLDDVAFITTEINQDMSGTVVHAHDLLLNITGASLGRCAVVPSDLGPANVSQHVTIIRLVDPTARHYIHLCLLSPLLQAMIWGRQVGMAREGLSKKVLEQFEIPIPPIKEQERIVKRVGELMALCDKLEAQQQARRQLQNGLRQATLQAVASATSPHELQTTWASLAANFGRLFHAPEDVAAIKGAILDLAMSGQLIGPEHRQTSTGTALLEEIAAQRIAWSQTASGQEQKEALAMLKKLRIQSVTEPEITLPQHWSWATLLHVAKVIIDCDHKTPVYATDGIHLIRTTDIRNGSMHLHSTKKVSQEGYLARSKRLTPEYGDIFFTREAPMGEAAIVPAGEQVCLGQRLMLIRLFEKYASNRFLLYAIQSPSFQRRMQAAAVGMTVKHINVGDVENLFVPMPPRLEQDQIVSTIDALFTLCDQYAGQLSQKLGVASRMGSTVINNFTGITTTKSEEPMKAPQTELIAPLRLGQAPDIKAQAPLASILARHQGQMLAKDLWQRFGGEIDAFYAQLKTEVAHGWILEPAVAEVREVPVATAGA